MASRALKGMWGRYILAFIATIAIQSMVSSLVLSLTNHTFQQTRETIIDYILEYFVFRIDDKFKYHGTVLDSSAGDPCVGYFSCL